MKVTNDRRTRGQRIRALRPEQFASYRDYFAALHLNPVVRWIHAIGMFIGTAIFAFGVASRSVWLVLASGSAYYFVPLFSHLVFDGCSPRNEAPDPITGHLQAIWMNVRTLVGSVRREEAALVRRYPFLASIYQDVQIR